jgi:group II intron reverse transcriptase/maturase
MILEPGVERVFHGDSYGYRPGRSPIDAVRVCRERCWRRDWIVDLDVRAFFDSVSWDLMLKAVARHTDQRWILMYVERWLKAPMQKADGTLARRTKGTPQGGPISPLIANVFLHYGFDQWMSREFPGILFERFADDVVVHCVTERQARQLRDAIGHRLAGIGLELHPEKTRIVYCKDSNRRLDYDEVSFTFCGYTFRPRKAYNKTEGKAYTSFLPAVGPGKLTDMRRKVSSWRIDRSTTLTLSELAGPVNQVMRGWLSYFTAFYPTAAIPVCRHVDAWVMRWARKKYKRLERSRRRAHEWLQEVRSVAPWLFAHWRLRYSL